MEKEASSRLASTIIFFSNLVKDDGTPRNPDYPPCVKTANKIRNLLILGRAERIPGLSEKGQMELAGQEEK